MLYAFAVLGFGLLLAGARAWRYSRRAFRATDVSARWRRWRRLAFIAGILLVISIPFHQYPYRRGTVMGFPFFAAWYDERGRDFIGVITPPALLGDAAVWFLVPQLVLAYRVRRDLRSPGESHTSAA